MPPICAISFDLWDTVFVDDSDEPKRAEQGLLPKPEARRELLERALYGVAPRERTLIDCAYDTADAAFRRVWHEQHVTWTVAERLQVVLAGLGTELPSDTFDKLVLDHEEMELIVSPDLVPGAAEAIANLAGKYTLVVCSDAIFSPGWALRKLLEKFDLLTHFSGFAFSDELGCSKPAPEMIHKAAEQAGCDLEELVHLGDREHNDVAGSKALGARSVLVTAAIDRGSRDTRADAVCASYSELRGIIAGLDQQ